jgi:hypothetical protein
MIKCAVAWAQINTGVSYSVWDNTSQDLPHFWIKSVREYLACIQASIQLDTLCIPPMQRTGDLYIMDHVLESRQFTSSEVRQINYCRLYLQARTLSDLALANGEW